MTIFRVPGDFPSISLAMDSPLVQRGDTILVKEGAYNQVVVVPFDKVGIRVMGDGGEDALENQVAGPPPDEPDNEKYKDGQPDPSGPSEETTGSPAGESDGDNAPLGRELPPYEAPLGSPGPEPLNLNTTVTRTGVKMIKVEQDSGPPYWVTIHRRTVERYRTPEKGRGRNPGSFWLKFR